MGKAAVLTVQTPGGRARQGGQCLGSSLRGPRPSLRLTLWGLRGLCRLGAGTHT